MIDLDLPTWIWAAFGGILATVGSTAAISMFRTVRKAAAVVGTNDKLNATIKALQATVAAQSECIETQEKQIASLTTDLAAAQKRIEQLENTVDELRRPRRRG